MAGNGMSGGHNRKPTIMKVLEGTMRKDRAVPNEPQPEKVYIPPPMPEGLNKYAQREWEKVTLELSKVGLLTMMDTSQLAAYCNEMGNYWECEFARREVVPVDESPDARDEAAKFYKNYFDMAQKHLSQARSLAVQYGFTPASRTKISAPTEKKQSELEAL